MSALVEVIAIISPFGLAGFAIGASYYYKALTKGLIGPRAKENQLDAEKTQQIEILEEERKQLEARVQNLESIVCSVDLELNARLNRLAAEQSQIGLLAASPAPSIQNENVKISQASTLAHSTSHIVLAEIAVGQKLLDRYQIERELGRGGMGAVFLARDEKLGELVALKVISQTLAGDPLAATERFRREASAARKVTHPNVIRIHDIGEESGLLFLSMEFFSGMTLMEMLIRTGPPPLEESKQILSQIADGLGAAHEAGIIHRDLKPHNVLIDSAKRVKLIDFGLAKAAFLHGMTATGIIMGTPEYMAPEQIRGNPVDARTDIYAFACLGYHLLAGLPPFRGDSPIAVSFAHCSQEPKPPRQIREEIPETMEAALLQALEKDPQKRFQTIEEMKQALLD